MSNLAFFPAVPTPEPAARPEKRERGEGRIYQIGRKKGEEVRGQIYWIQYYFRGRQIRESSKSTKRQVAVELLQTRMAEKLAGDTPAKDAKTLRYTAMRERLYRHCEQRELKSLLRREKDGRVEVYLGTVSGEALDEHFKDCTAADITRDRLDDFVRNRQRARKSNATINRSLTALKQMFSLAIKAKELPTLAMPDFPRLKEPKARKDFFTKEEYEKVYAQLPDYLKPVFAVAYHSGMRTTELLSRNWRHIDFEAGLIVLEEGETKNGEGRVIPIIGPVAGLLQEQRAANPNSEFVFTRNGERIRDFRRAWRTALGKAGLVAGIKNGGHVFHGNRRSMATNLLDAGVDEQSAQQITGHIDKDMLRRYRQLRKHNAQATGRKLEAHLAGQFSGQPENGGK